MKLTIVKKSDKILNNNFYTPLTINTINSYNIFIKKKNTLKKYLNF